VHDGLVRAAERAHDIGATGLQVFIDNPTAWKRRSGPPADLEAFIDRLVAHDLRPLAVHASYLVNLAGPDDELRERSIELLGHEMVAARSFGARFVNVHVGSHKGAGVAAGVAGAARAIARVLGDVPHGRLDDGATGGPPLLVLENSAGGGGGMPTTVEELAAILDAATAQGVDPSAVGLCLDAAHLWGAGTDVGSPDAVDALLAEVDARIGLAHLVMVHLNDSKAGRGSRNDRHQHLGAGEIGPAGLARLLSHPALAHVLYIIETPGMEEGYDAVNLDRARRLAAGLPLAPLPPEALEMRGSRAGTPAA
jgi:deoxyribonuclease-4